MPQSNEYREKIDGIQRSFELFPLNCFLLPRHCRNVRGTAAAGRAKQIFLRGYPPLVNGEKEVGLFNRYGFTVLFSTFIVGSYFSSCIFRYDNGAFL